MNAIDFILQEHTRIRRLALQAMKKVNFDKKSRHAVISDLGKELILHETMEQKIWYPLVTAPATKQTISHLIKEEHSAKKAIEKLKNMNPNSSHWIPNFNKLIKDVEHHSEEEETKLLPILLVNLSPLILNHIGSKLSGFKRKAPKSTRKTSKKNSNKKKSRAC